VKGRGIRWRYKATGKPLDYQMRVYPRGADRTTPDEIVANVWAWEPDWTVTWYEDGVRLGAMSQRTGLDPEAVAQQTDPDLPPKRPWVDLVRTRHLFYAPVSPEAKDVRVEATDGWGRTYGGVIRDS
jgi:C terminal of Calcineurin-like phosphoesterase